jgi:HAD superfamily hydrolase (TIGR01509 family)
MEVFKHFPNLNELRRSQPHLRGVLFDMDGTLLMTEELHGDVLRDMAQDWKLRPPFPPHEVETRLKGMADRQVLELARDWEGFPAGMTEEKFIQDKNLRLLELIPKRELTSWCAPEMTQFLESARADGLILAVVTSSERIITDALLGAAKLRPFFDLVITLQDVLHAKPHPWPYLKAMQTLNLGPRETLIFEDSAPGMAAAKASGARVIGAQWWENYSSARKM